MFAKNPVSQSMIDAVNKVLGEKTQEIAPVQSVEQPKHPFAPQILGESDEKVQPHDDEKEDKKLIKKMVDKSCLKKEDMTFAEKLKASIKEGKGNGPQEMFTDNNLGEEEMSDAQMKKREKIVMSMKGKTADFKQRYGKNWKNVMYATATKQAMAEEVELEEGFVDDIKQSFAKGMTDKLKKIIPSQYHKHYDFDSVKSFSDSKELLKKAKLAGHMKEEVELDEADTKNTDLKHRQDMRRKEGMTLHLQQMGKNPKQIEKLMKKMKMPHSEETVVEGKMKAIVTNDAEDKRVGSSPKKGTDIADKAYLKHKPGTVKGTMTQIGRFLKGKPEIKEDVEVDVDTKKNADKVTTDMLKGRVVGGKMNSFKNYKLDLKTGGEEKLPKELEHGIDTKEKQKITTNPGAVEVKLDDKYGKPSPHNEEVRGELKNIRNKEGHIRDKEVNDFRSKQKEGGLVEDEQIDEKTIAGTPGWEKQKKDVTDKSGAVHTPMSRAKDLARLSFKKIKSDLGKKSK